MFNNKNWFHRTYRLEKETCSRIAGDTWNSGIFSFCAWLNIYRRI